jgi:hypothetical protein
VGRRGYLSALGASGALAAAGALALLLASLYVTFNGWPGLRDPVDVKQTVKLGEPGKPAPGPRGLQLPTPAPSSRAKPAGRRFSPRVAVAVWRPAADQDVQGAPGSRPAPAHPATPAEPLAPVAEPPAELPSAERLAPAAEPLPLDAPALGPVSEVVERTTERLPVVDDVVQQVQDVVTGDGLRGILAP